MIPTTQVLFFLNSQNDRSVHVPANIRGTPCNVDSDMKSFIFWKRASSRKNPCSNREIILTLDYKYNIS